jgi:hypothetical protein
MSAAREGMAEATVAAADAARNDRREGDIIAPRSRVELDTGRTSEDSRITEPNHAFPGRTAGLHPATVTRYDTDIGREGVAVPQVIDVTGLPDEDVEVIEALVGVLKSRAGSRGGVGPDFSARADDLLAWMKTLPRGNPNFDDGREAIYDRVGE